jgi:cyanophycinase
MMGPIALHGGGEFLPGDERFLDELLDVTTRAANGHASQAGGIRVAILPTAASRGLPDRAAAFAVETFQARARARGQPIRVDVARVVDAASAADDEVAKVIAAADLIYLPGGDPDIVPALLGPTTAAGRALEEAHRRGAIVAGASAGAMVLADWSWTAQGGIPGLGFAPGLIVVPHYDEIRRMEWQGRLDSVAPPGFGYLGLDERTGVISDDGGWRVVGEGAAYWFSPGSNVPIVAHHGESINLPS